MPDQYTWTGRSLVGPKIAFKDLTNIIKLFHAVVNQYVSASLDFVSELMYKKVLKHSKSRARRTHKRLCASRNYIISSKRKSTVDATEGDEVESAINNGGDNDAESDDNEAERDDESGDSGGDNESESDAGNDDSNDEMPIQKRLIKKKRI